MFSTSGKVPRMASTVTFVTYFELYFTRMLDTF